MKSQIVLVTGATSGIGRRIFSFLVVMSGLVVGCDDDAGNGGAGGQPEGAGGAGPVGGAGGDAPVIGGAGGSGANMGGEGVGGEGGAGGAGGAPNTNPDVIWSNVNITGGCFLFSDPDQLGTAVTWTDEGGTITLGFDAVERSYAGPSGAASLTLQGDHEQRFAGDIWKYQEIFSGTLTDGVFQGTWSYTECDFTVEPENCPGNGACEGSAEFAITVPTNDD